MNTEHASPELFAALSAAQGEIENASKNAANPHFKSKYADLAEVLTTIRDTLPKHGLSLIQSPSFDGSLVSVTTILAHKSGGYITAIASCVPAKSDAQGVGSATTYLRRYSAAAMAGIAQEDDDGQAAAHNTPPVDANKVADWINAIRGAGTHDEYERLKTEMMQAFGNNPPAKVKAAFSAQLGHLNQSRAA